MRLPTFISIMVSIFVASAGAGQIKGPSESTVPVGRLVGISLTVDGDDAEYTVLGGDYFGAFREFSDAKTFRFQVLGYAPGSGYIVLAAVKDGKLQPIFTITVKVTGTPVPPVPPDPPKPPTDPLVEAIKATGTPAATLGTIAIALRGASGLAVTGQTAARVQEAIKLALAKNIPDGIPDKLFPVLATELKVINGILPASDPEHVVTDAERDKVRAIYLKLAVACEGAK